MWRRKKATGFVEVDGGVVGWFSGGEPIEGCEVVSVLISASSEDAAEDRLRSIGLWSPYLMEGVGQPAEIGVQAAQHDPNGFVWNHADGGEWRPSVELLRSTD